MVGLAAKIDEALRLASQADLDTAILDVNVGGAVVFQVADLLRGRGVPTSLRPVMSGRVPSRFENAPTNKIV